MQKDTTVPAKKTQVFSNSKEAHLCYYSHWFNFSLLVYIPWRSSLFIDNQTLWIPGTLLALNPTAAQACHCNYTAGKTKLSRAGLQKHHPSLGFSATDWGPGRWTWATEHSSHIKYNTCYPSSVCCQWDPCHLPTCSHSSHNHFISGFSTSSYSQGRSKQTAMHVTN